MKARCLIFSLLMLPAMTALAMDGDSYYGVSVGALYKNSLAADIVYEKDLSYHDAYEISLFAGNKWDKDPVCGKVCNSYFWKDWFYGAGLTYKKAVATGKNSVSRVRIGVNGSSDMSRMTLGTEVGFEWTHYFYSGIALTVTQKNLIFWNQRHSDRYKNGLEIGFRIPLYKH
jgi:hypothetical protein